MARKTTNRKIIKKIAQSSTTVALSMAAALTLLPNEARPQSINCFQNMDFGSIVPCPATADTIRLAPTGGTVAGGCAGAGGSPLRGRCLLVGSFFPVRPMQVTLSTPAITLTNGTTNMNVTNFDWNTTSGGNTTTVTAFIAVVNLGATLNVGINQNGGTYTGSTIVTVNFQ